MPRQLLDTTEIHYEVFGKGAPILFLPGLGVGGNIWMPVIEHLADRYQCITMDTRGVGYSDTPKGPYRIEDMALDAGRLIDALTLAPPVVAGHSMGGFVALTLSLTLRKPLLGLFLVATAPRGRNVNEAVIGTRVAAPRIDVVERIVKYGVGSRTPRERAAQLRSLILSRPLRGSGYLSQQAAARGFDLDAALGDVSVPCCILHGTEDRLIPVETGRQMAARIPGAQFIALAGTGHFPIVEQPEETADTLVSWIKTAFSA